VANSRDTTLVPQLKSYLNDPSPLVRQGAAFALGQLQSSSAIGILSGQVLVEHDKEVQCQMILSLGKIGDLKTALFLYDHFQSTSLDITLIHSYIYFFSRGVVSDKLVKDCIGFLDSKNSTARQMAAIALQRIPSHENLVPYIDKLLHFAGNPDPFVRQSIARILRQVDFPEKDDLYRQLMNDTEWRVRYEAALILESLPESNALWLDALRDVNPHVVAAALQNTPQIMQFNEQTIALLDSLFNSGSVSVRSTMVQIVFSRPDSILNDLRDSLTIDDLLLPFKATGLSAQISRDSFSELLFLSNHRLPTVSSAAYIGLVSMLDSLISSNTITDNEYINVLIHGLNSHDPVQIYIAADHIFESPQKGSVLKTHLYSCLDNNREFRFQESTAMVLRAIEKLTPPDAPTQLYPLLISHQKLLRDEAYRILTETYSLNIPKPTDVDDPYLYSNLSKIRQYGLKPVVRIMTNRGAFSIRCDGYFTPFTVDAFLNRVDSGFYNGLIFHRVIPNFVVQGGDPRGDGWSGPGYHLLTEKSPLGYDMGSVGMANAGPDTEGSQFFITTSPQYHLDYNYSRFGEVIEGMDVVLKIKKGDKIITADVLVSSN